MHRVPPTGCGGHCCRQLVGVRDVGVLQPPGYDVTVWSTEVGPIAEAGPIPAALRYHLDDIVLEGWGFWCHPLLHAWHIENMRPLMAALVETMACVSAVVFAIVFSLPVVITADVEAWARSSSTGLVDCVAVAMGHGSIQALIKADDDSDIDVSQVLDFCKEALLHIATLHGCVNWTLLPAPWRLLKNPPRPPGVQAGSPEAAVLTHCAAIRTWLVEVTISLEHRSVGSLTARPFVTSGESGHDFGDDYSDESRDSSSDDDYSESLYVNRAVVNMVVNIPLLLTIYHLV
jgi:hypothetical protein